jgi:hypothetical protein
MPPPRRAALRSAFPLGLALCLATSGCVPVFVSATSGRLLPPDVVERIRPGETTAREVLEGLGPPLAVGRPGTRLHIPRLDVRRVGALDIDADPAGGWRGATADPTDLVYYYEAVEIRDSALQLDVYPGVRTEGSLERRWRADRVWLLVSRERRVKACVRDRLEGGTPRAPAEAGGTQ